MHKGNELLATWSMSFSDISAYSLDCKGFNHSELVNPPSRKYQTTETIEQIYRLNYLRIVRTQITWAQGFHNLQLHRKLVKFYDKERISWYTKTTITLTGVNLCFSCSLIEDVHFLQQSHENFKKLKSHHAFIGRKLRIQEKNYW